MQNRALAPMHRDSERFRAVAACPLRGAVPAERTSLSAGSIE